MIFEFSESGFNALTLMIKVKDLSGGILFVKPLNLLIAFLVVAQKFNS